MSPLPQDIPIAFPVQVEIGMVRKVDHGRFVGLCGECQFECIVLAPLVVGHYLQVARIAGLSILGNVHELDGIPDDPAVPYLVLETLGAAVEMVRAVVHRKGIFDTVKREFSLCDPVGISARALSGAGAVGEIIIRLRISQDHVSQLAFLVRNGYGHYRSSHAAQADEGAGSVLYGVQEDFLPFGGNSP